MSFNFYVSNQVAFNQNTTLFISNMSVESNSHYVIDVDMGNSLNDLFNTRTYQQNQAIGDGSVNENDYNTILAINHTELFSRLNDSHSLIFKGSSGNTALGAAILGQDVNNQPYYIRLLEIMALNIFGHAKARAAIANDKSFKDKVLDIDTHLEREFNTNEPLRNEFFEQYIQLDRQEINANDVNTVVNFNLDDAQISFLAYLTGSVLDTNTNGSVNSILNSPIANTLVSDTGFYNIEVLTKLNGRAL